MRWVLALVVLILGGCKMPDGNVPQIEEVLFRNFQGWEVHNMPPTDLLPRLVGEGQLIDGRGVVTDPDGVLRWRRDQFTVPAVGQTLLDVFEYKTASDNQLLALCADGHLYKLETDWANAAGTQFAYGYQLFNAVSWDDVTSGLQTSGRHGFAAAKNILLVGHQDQATKRWDGEDLTDVGFATPASCFGATSAFTGYTEVDAGAYLTITAARITAALLPKNATAYTYLDFGAGEISDFTARWTFQITASSGDGAHFYMLGCKNSVGVFSGTTDWIGFGVRRWGAVYRLTKSDSVGDTGTGELSLSTTYYAELRREGNEFTFTVYSDATYATEVAHIHGYDGTAFRYLYAGCALGGGAEADTINGYIDGLTMTAATVGSGQLVAGTYSYYMTYASDEFESMPSNIIDVVVSADDGNISLAGIKVGPTGTTSRKLYRAFTSDVTQGARGASFQFLAEIDENATTFTDNALQASLGLPIAFDHAIPPRGDLLLYHNDRAFIANCSCSSRSYDDYDTTGLENVVFYSQLDEPYYFPGLNYLPVGDSSPVMAMVGWRDWVFFFKENSVWVLRGYTTDEFRLDKLTGEYGITSFNAAASGPPGVVWRDKGGLMFFDGATVRTIRDYDLMSISPDASTVTKPTIAYHRQKFYFLESDYLLTWDPVRAVWSYQAFNETTVGIRAFNFGRYQSHLLSYWEWHSGSSYLGVKDTGQQFTYYDTQGSTTSEALFAPVQITLPGLLARPGEEIVPLEVWIDGSWVAHATEARRPYLYLNDDADYSSTAGQNAWQTTPLAPADGEVIGVPSGYQYDSSMKTNAFRTLYIQIKATEAEDFELNAVGLRFYRRPGRG